MLGAALAGGGAALIATLVCCARPEAAPAEGAPPPSTIESPTPRRPDAPVEICVGEAHSCVRTEGGKVACWGDNTERQVALIAAPQVEAPRWLDVPPSASLRCDARQTCVRTTVGDVYCLGGTAAAEKVALPGAAIDLAVHRGGGCVLLASGHPWCWAQPPPLRTQPPAAARSAWAVPGAPVLTRFSSAPALSSVVCGDTASGPVCIRGAEQLDTASVAPAEGAPRGTTSFAVGAGEANALGSVIPSGASAVALGAEHACAIRDGQVFCWGAASRGQLGSGGYVHASALEVPGIADAVELDVGASQACVVRRTGGLSCWGALSGRGAAVDVVFAPRALPVPQPALDVRAAHHGAAGTPHEWQQQPTCLRSAAGWSCWERDAFRPAKPLAATPLGRWHVAAAQVSPDGQCAVTTTGALVCAGEYSFASSNRSLATALLRFESDVPIAETSATFAVAGQPHVCARTVRGNIRCYAASATTRAAIDAPGLAALNDIVSIRAAGIADDGAACALARAGTVFCWGEGRWSQVPGTSPRSPWEPAAITGVPPVAEIGVGGDFVCARTTSGKVYCWGSNRLGTAPNGLPGESKEPLAVQGL
jgi:hypothetical protein